MTVIGIVKDFKTTIKYIKSLTKKVIMLNKKWIKIKTLKKNEVEFQIQKSRIFEG